MTCDEWPFGHEQLSIYLLLHVLSIKKLHATSFLDNYKKDKDAIFACLQKFYGNTTTFPDEHIYSDGRSSEFKSQYMIKLLHHVSKQHSAKFTRDYFATDHGKGVVDGIGGKQKVWFSNKFWVKQKCSCWKSSRFCSSMWRVYAKHMCAFNDARWLNCCTKI